MIQELYKFDGECYKFILEIDDRSKKIIEHYDKYFIISAIVGRLKSIESDMFRRNGRRNERRTIDNRNISPEIESVILRSNNMSKIKVGTFYTSNIYFDKSRDAEIVVITHESLKPKSIFKDRNNYSIKFPIPTKTTSMDIVRMEILKFRKDKSITDKDIYGNYYFDDLSCYIMYKVMTLDFGIDKVLDMLPKHCICGLAYANALTRSNHCSNKKLIRYANYKIELGNIIAKLVSMNYNMNDNIKSLAIYRHRKEEK